METIAMIRLMWAEIIINGALIIANIATWIKARNLLREADAIWREAIADRQEAEKVLEAAKAYKAGK